MTRTERRRHPRIQVDLPLRLTIRNRTVRTRIRDLSRCGIRFEAPDALPLMSRVHIALELPEREGHGAPTPLAITGVVVRCDRREQGSGGGYDTAIYFEDLSESARAQLSQFVAARRA